MACIQNEKKRKREVMTIVRNVAVYERYIVRAVGQSHYVSDIHNSVDNEILSCFAFSKFV